MKYRLILTLGFISVILGVAQRPLQAWLFEVTGEEAPLAQMTGFTQYVLTRLQPPLQTADTLPVRHADVNPYGINTFLQTEVEPAKREQAMKMISEAGIRWIRQEFTWEDIEIHGKGDFEDRRHEPYQSAWLKYDHIVELAEKYNIKIMARLSNPPSWTRALTNTIGTFAPPDNLSDYGDFVEAVANRYHGRIAAYQIWNEPNIFPEWGYYPINAADYTALLKEGATRVKQTDPEAIVVMGALAATIELDRERRYAPDGNVVSPGGLSDVLFLQQMYDAGAAPYFDVLAMQGYGLWSGPTDRRMQPRVLNFSRPLYIRDVMVRNGDAHKPIWLSELGWNAVPPETGLPPIYGQVTLAQQARYTVLAYHRMEAEWPWLGVGFYWFFKQADEREKANNPQYYFRMVDPDFTPMPIYEAMKQFTHQPAQVYRGFHAPDHWAIRYEGAWQISPLADTPFNLVQWTDQAEARLDLTFEGRSLDLIVTAQTGRVRLELDQLPPRDVDLTPTTRLVDNGSTGVHHVTLTVLAGEVNIAGWIVH